MIEENQSRCPHLGRESDPETPVRVPSLRNRCHRVQPPRPVGIARQDMVCLSVNHVQCPGVMAEGPLPESADFLAGETAPDLERLGRHSKSARLRRFLKGLLGRR